MAGFCKHGHEPLGSIKCVGTFTTSAITIASEGGLW